MLSWEYPPVLVGGLGRHVHALATSLAAAGHEVTVVTRHAAGAPLEELREGVRVVRAPEDPPTFPLATPTLLAWTMSFNHALTRAALHAAATESFDVIHAHDWLVTHTAVTMRDHLGIPLVATIHATEAGRHQGWLPEEMNKTIHTVEYWLGHEAAHVITCSAYMRWEVSHLLGLAPEDIAVIANGVDAPVWQAPPRAVAQARARYAGDGPMIGFAGRLVYEKGVQHVIHALPELRDRHPGLRLVIAGDGPYRPELQAEVARLRLESTVNFAGSHRRHLPRDHRQHPGEPGQGARRGGHPPAADRGPRRQPAGRRRRPALTADRRSHGYGCLVDWCTMSDDVIFWFDPSCPYTWRTSRWLLAVTGARNLTIDWRLMSLAILNEDNQVSPRIRAAQEGGRRAGRVLTAVDEKYDTDAVERVYTEIGTRVHEDGRDIDERVLTEALGAAGLPADLYFAVEDDEMDEYLVESHYEGQERAGMETGSPIIVFGDGPGFFGPIVVPVPEGEAAEKLFDAVRLLSAVPEFSELKRARNRI